MTSRFNTPAVKNVNEGVLVQTEYVNSPCFFDNFSWSAIETFRITQNCVSCRCECVHVFSSNKAAHSNVLTQTEGQKDIVFDPVCLLTSMEIKEKMK